MELVGTKADILRQEALLRLKNKLVSLKFDTSTKFGRHFLSINIQFFQGGKLTLRHLKCMVFKERSTAKYLKDQIYFVLKLYDLSISQVISFTVDNGANMLAAIKQKNNDIANITLKNDDLPHDVSQTLDQPTSQTEELYSQNDNKTDDKDEN